MLERARSKPSQERTFRRQGVGREWGKTGAATPRITLEIVNEFLSFPRHILEEAARELDLKEGVLDEALEDARITSRSYIREVSLEQAMNGSDRGGLPLTLEDLVPDPNHNTEEEALDEIRKRELVGLFNPVTMKSKT